MSNGTRKQVTKITVEFNDGTKKTYPDNGYMPVALFWSDHSVIDILGSYYDGLTTSRQMKHPDMKKHFGPIRTDKVFNDPQNQVSTDPQGRKQVRLTKRVIEEIWNTPNQVLLPPLMSKDPGCDPGG